MTITSPTTPTPRPFQFSLRTLLLLMLLIGCGLGWLVRETIDAREKASRRATLQTLMRWSEVERLDLNGFELITDTNLTYLRKCRQIRAIDLGNTQITDAGLEHLRGLTLLQELDLSNTKVTDAGVAELQRVLPNCKISR